MAEVRERDTDGVVDFCCRGEGRIEILSIKLAHQLEDNLARNLPMEFSSGEFTCRFASHMDGEGRRCGVKELFGMIVREDDPKIGLQCAQAPTDVSRYLAYVLDDRLVLGIRHGEELRRM